MTFPTLCPGCGRATRPVGTTSTQFPNTLLGKSHGACSTCHDIKCQTGKYPSRGELAVELTDEEKTVGRMVFRYVAVESHREEVLGMLGLVSR